MTGHKVEWEGELDGFGIVSAEGLYTPGSPGSFNPYDGGHPPEGAMVDDLIVTDSNGWDITNDLTEIDYDFICEQLERAWENSVHERD